MGDEIPVPSGFVAWGPFVRDNYEILRVTRADLVVAGIAFALANLFGLTAAFIAVRHTKASRQPWRSTYIWMIWLELAASVALSIICLLYLLRIIQPSFYFFMGVLVCWVVQIQLLPQIIINRIRIILQDRKRGKRLVGGTAAVITLINISVFCIWIPSRLQISERWVKINDGWDRTEKVLFLLLDGYLNWYFIRVVDAELVKNGLTKYNRLVRFNKRIIVVSLLLDVMIIGAMSIPNGFVYAMFHPLAYIVKLNIEMSMAHLIRAIALDNRRPSEDPSHLLSPPSPEVNTFNTNMYAEVPRQRHSLIRGLFSSEHVVFPHEDVRARVPENISEQSTTVPDFELPNWKPRLSKESGPDAVEGSSLHEVFSNTTMHREDIREDSGISQADAVAAGAQHLSAPDPVFLPARTSEAG